MDQPVIPGIESCVSELCHRRCSKPSNRWSCFRPTRKMNDVPAAPYRHGPRRRTTHDFVALICKVVGGGPEPVLGWAKPDPWARDDGRERPVRQCQHELVLDGRKAWVPTCVGMTGNDGRCVNHYAHRIKPPPAMAIGEHAGARRDRRVTNPCATVGVARPSPDCRAMSPPHIPSGTGRAAATPAPPYRRNRATTRAARPASR